MTAKERHKVKLLEYLGNPDNPFLNRSELAEKVLKIKRRTFYDHFTPADLSEIEKEALEIRRGKYAAGIARVDRAMIDAAASGDSQAAKLIYQKFENWAPSTRQEHTGKNGGPIEVSLKTILDEIDGESRCLPTESD